MRTILSKRHPIIDLIPSFTVREMLLLSFLLAICGLFFVQNFALRSPQDVFNDALDNIFKLSELHKSLDEKLLSFDKFHQTRRFEDGNSEYKELIRYYKKLFSDVENFPRNENQPLLTNYFDSIFINSKNEDIDYFLGEYKEVLNENSYKKIAEHNFQAPLYDIYNLIRAKQESYIYLANNYRAATLITLFLIIFYSSYVFIRHYAQERTRAIQSSNAKTNFLANMSHEIRTPLNGIIGMSELIQSTALSGEQSKYFKALLSSAENLNELINDILDITKIEAGHIELELVPFNLNEILDTLISSFQLRAKSKKLPIIKEVSPDLHMTYMGDPTRIRQILNNLIGNALKFTETGHIKILVTTSAQNPDNLYFQVEDTGIGIPEDKRSSIFQKFSQADTSTTRKYGGTGLGLVITKNLVHFMGGQIDFKSNEFKGTTFWFSIPLLKLPPEAISIIDHTTLAPIDFSSIAGKRILLVEDNIINQEYTLKVLRDMKLETALADTGVAAVQYFRDHGADLDLILMDCRMPEMDGYEATQLIRKLETIQNPTQRVPIIALTANAIKGDIEKCMQCGMDDYLTKPIHRRTLETTLSNWLFSAEKEEIVVPTMNDSEDIQNIIDITTYQDASNIMGDDMSQLIKHYTDSIFTYVEKMEASLKTKNYKDIGEAAHPLKSSSASIGAQQMKILCEQIETIALADDPDNILPSLIIRINTASQRTIQKLKDLENERA